MVAPAPSAARRYALLIGTALAIQFALVSWTFPLRELFTVKPLFWIDSAYHWYQMTVAMACGAEHSVVCYDPLFAAGYPAGVTYNWSAKFPALAAMIASPLLDVAQTYKLYSFASAVLGPMCIGVACWILRLRLRVAVLATAWAFLLWWASLLRWYHTAGMVSFVLGSFASLIYVACVYRILASKSDWRWFIGLALVGATAMFYHPLFAIPVGFAVAGIVATQPDRATLRRIPVLAAIAALSLLPNLLWIIPMLHFQHGFGIDMRIESPYQQTVDLHVLWQELLGRWQGHAQGSRLYAPTALAAIWACASSSVERGPQRVARGLLLGALALGLFAAVGAVFPAVAGLQPNRFLPVVYVLLSIPAAIGTAAAFGRWRRGNRPVVRTAAFATTGIMLLAGLYGIREVSHELSYDNSPHYGEPPPEVKGIGETTQWIETWLRSNTDPSARILFETSPGRHTDDAHVAGYLAQQTGREFIGGPYPYSQFANFWDHTVFRRPIDSYSPEAFREYLRTYNVGWIVAYTDRSRAFLDRLTYVAPEQREGSIGTYRVDLPHDFFLEGSGQVVARDKGMLVLANVTGEEVVLKYHFVDGLVANPPLDLRPFQVLNDPNPFVRVVHPPPAFTLRLP